LKDLSNDISKILNEIDALKKKAEEDLGIEVKLVDSNSYTYLFEVSKKTGDNAFRSSGKKYKQISIKNNKISFNNDKLVELCAHYSDFMSQYKEEQNTVVDKILNVVSTYYPAMENSAFIISELDVLLTFASISANAPKPYKKPMITMIGGNLFLKESRHPCLEMTDKQNCVSNDCEMNQEKSKLHIITGPNMGGKSTYIRQVAICILMAHIGIFIILLE
jgi:DNA mismatch repair protein MSH2